MARRISLKQKPDSDGVLYKKKLTVRESLLELHMPASSKHTLGCLGVLLNGCSMLQLDPPAWLLVPLSCLSSVERVTHWLALEAELRGHQGVTGSPARHACRQCQTSVPAVQEQTRSTHLSFSPGNQYPTTLALESDSLCIHDLLVICCQGMWTKLKNKIKGTLFFQWKSLSQRCRRKKLPFSFRCNQSLYVIWVLVGISLPESCLLVGVSEVMGRWKLTIIAHISHGYTAWMGLGWYQD